MGLIPVFDPTARANLAHALETAILLELECRGADQRFCVRTADRLEVTSVLDIRKGTRS